MKCRSCYGGERCKRGRKTIREFLVTWTGYPLEEAMWIPEDNFMYPRLLKQMIKRDKPIKEK